MAIEGAGRRNHLRGQLQREKARKMIDVGKRVNKGMDVEPF